MNKFNRGYKLNKARRRNYQPIDTGNGTTYTVKKGDSPWAIAYSRGMSLDEFYRLNPKARNGIYAGDQVTFAAPNTKSYKVKKGDYPWKIAQDNGISLEDLYEYNPNAKKMIYPNDELRIPVKGDNGKQIQSSKAANDSNSNKAANSTPANGNAQPAPKDTTKSQVAPKDTVTTDKSSNKTTKNGGYLPEVVVVGNKSKKDLETATKQPSDDERFRQDSYYVNKYYRDNTPSKTKPKKDLETTVRQWNARKKNSNRVEQHQNSSASVWDIGVPRSQASKVYDYRYDNALFDFGDALNIKNKKKLGGKLKRRGRLSI